MKRIKSRIGRRRIIAIYDAENECAVSSNISDKDSIIVCNIGLQDDVV